MAYSTGIKDENCIIEELQHTRMGGAHRKEKNDGRHQIKDCKILDLSPLGKPVRILRMNIER